jgi:hypothetical protein
MWILPYAKGDAEAAARVQAFRAGARKTRLDLKGEVWNEAKVILIALATHSRVAALYTFRFWAAEICLFKRQPSSSLSSISRPQRRSVLRSPNRSCACRRDDRMRVCCCSALVRLWQILLQKSQIAPAPIFLL